MNLYEAELLDFAFQMAMWDRERQRAPWYTRVVCFFL